MSDGEIQGRFEALLSDVRRPARLIGGEVGAGPGFTGAPEPLRVVLGFPDTYEIGISNQAIQILYGLARQAPDVEVERTYLPWVDVIAEMRSRRIPLLTMESWEPVREADVLGVTLQHELGYTNLLEMLDLAGIPLRAEQREEIHPLVIAGGPACANFLPMAPFLDAAVIGDGEEVFAELLGVLREAKREGLARFESRATLSGVEGVYVPGVSTSVARRCLSRLTDAPYPEECLVPLTEGVHDRAWVEVMRGCTRGCRFCQAGMWYRPVRERSPGEVLDVTEQQLRASGYQEVAFASLSTTDYSCLETLLERAARRLPETKVSLPSLRADSTAVKLARLASPTGPSLTLAPEAGSQRMRDIINKNVTQADIMGAAHEAFRSGKTTLKLYFMIGLPWEEDDDVEAIVALCMGLRELGREVLGARASRLRLNVSVNNFVPKPFTPFQWAGVAGRDTLARRQKILRDGLHKRGVQLALSRVDESYLEAALARGGEETAGVIERAWRGGARFDSWAEEFRADAWEEALASAGLSAEKLATTSLDTEGPLPWDVVAGSVRREFLIAEWEKAQQAVTTGDCRWEGCSDCGVCTGGLENDLSHAEALPTDSGEETAGPATPVTGGGAERRWRYRVNFSVTGRGRYLGHLDRAEVLRRAVRRAGGRLALSAGLRPKPLLSLALPLAVGTEGAREMGEFFLAEQVTPEFAARLASCLPVGTRLLGVEPGDEGSSLASRVVGASYDVWIQLDSGSDGGGEGAERVLEACRRFGESESLEVLDERQGRERRIDVRRYVDEVAARQEQGEEETLVLSFSAKIGPGGTVRPEHVVKAVAGLAGIGLDIVRMIRTGIRLSEVGG